MTDEINIFKNHERFEQRGNPGVEVDWHLFTAKNLVAYIDAEDNMSWVDLAGCYAQRSGQSRYDLVPMLPSPVMVPWDCHNDVPEDCWVREKNSDVWLPDLVVGFDTARRVLTGGASLCYQTLFDVYEWHTNRKAKDGWQVCGKPKYAQK